MFAKLSIQFPANNKSVIGEIGGEDERRQPKTRGRSRLGRWSQATATLRASDVKAGARHRRHFPAMSTPPPTPPPSPAVAEGVAAPIASAAAAAAATSVTEATALLPLRRPSCDTMELRPLAGRVSAKMENAGFEREESLSRGQSSDRVATVELSEVASSPASAVPVAAPPLSVNGGATAAITCSEHCQALHMQHQRKAAEAAAAGLSTGRQPPESPWHHLKTVFLVGTLVFLALWIVIYTLLSQLSLL